MIQEYLFVDDTNRRLEEEYRLETADVEIFDVENSSCWIVVTYSRSGENEGSAKGQDKNVDRQIENKFNAFKAYTTKHNLHWGFVRDKDKQLYINNTEFAADMADKHWVPLSQEF